MATGGGKGWKEQDGGGSGSWLLTGLKIGAALGAAALGTYAAVKLAQEEKKEHPMRSRCSSSSSSDDDERGDLPSSTYRGSTPRGTGPGRVSKPQRMPPGTLVDELNEFYRSHINTSSAKQMAIQDLVEKTRQRISSYLIKNHRRLIKAELTPAAFDNLYSSQQTEFNLMLPLAFNPKIWEFIDAADTILDMPGFFCVRRINLDFFPIGGSPWDHFLIGSYLCPELLVESWKKSFERMLGEEMVLDFYCSVKRSAGGIDMNIENPVGSYADMICIKIIPFMKFKNNHELITITTRSVTHLQTQARSLGKGMTSNPHENLWFQSWEEEAVRKMETLEFLDGDGGCRRKCLAILDSLRYTQPPLRMLSSYLMMTILLKFCDEETEWEEDMLAERFLDLLKSLEGYLRAGSLRDHFNDKVDVLAQCCSSSGLVAESQRWLANILESKDKISDLLYN